VPEILRQVDHRVEQIDEPPQCLAKRAQARVPEVIRHKELAHQAAKAIRRGIRVAGVGLLDGGKFRHALLNRGALARPACAHGCAPGAERLRLPIFQRAAVILPVVAAVVVRQHDVHIGSVLGVACLPVKMFAQRVRRANLHAALLVRFVQRREQQHQERHVIRQRQAAGKAVPLLEHPAQAAVAALIAILLRLRQPLQICDHISEHTAAPQVFRWKDVPHLRQTILILPLPRGTRRRVRQDGHLKKR
jgi:hypothetical protein